MDGMKIEFNQCHLTATTTKTTWTEPQDGFAESLQ